MGFEPTGPCGRPIISQVPSPIGEPVSNSLFANGPLRKDPVRALSVIETPQRVPRMTLSAIRQWNSRYLRSTGRNFFFWTTHIG